MSALLAANDGHPGRALPPAANMTAKGLKATRKAALDAANRDFLITPFLPHELHPIPLFTAFPPEANS